MAHTGKEGRFCIVCVNGNVLCCRGPLKGWGWNAYWHDDDSENVVTFPTAGDALEWMAGKSMFGGGIYLGIHHRSKPAGHAHDIGGEG